MKLNSLRKLILSLITGMLALAATGQEMLGVTTGVYSGSNGISLNPAFAANSPMAYDINLFTVHGHLDNDYFYLPSGETGFIRVIARTYEFPSYPKPFGTGERALLSSYDKQNRKFIYLNGRLTGPSFLLSAGSHVFVFHTALRLAGSVRRLPYDIANFSFYGMDFYPQHNIEYDRKDYDLAVMGWWETGISYSTVLSRNANHHWSAGVTLNFLAGYSGAYVTSEQTRYVVYNDSILNVINLDAGLGFALPVDYNTDETRYLSDPVRGFGMGVDIGVSYQYSSRPYLKKPFGRGVRRYFEPYDFKLGLSLLDVGGIKFTRDAEKHVYDHVNNPGINVNRLSYDNIRDEIDETSRLLYGDPSASLADRRFTIYLPAAVSLQADYHFIGPWYFNAMMIFPVKFTTPMVERQTIFAMNPRYETKNVAFHVPFVLSGFQYPRLGLAVRLFGLTLGSDRLGAFFKWNELKGMDFYASYKVNIYYRDRRYGNRRDPCDTF